MPSKANPTIEIVESYSANQTVGMDVQPVTPEGTMTPEATPAGSPESKTARKRRQKRERELALREEAKARPIINLNAQALATHAINSIGYIVDVVARVFQLIKFPLSALIALSLAVMIVSRFTSSLLHSLSHSPICKVPVISTALPFCEWKSEPTEPLTNPYERLTQVQSDSFEKLLDQSAGGSGLSLEIKKAEMATVDLVTLLRVSDLTSKELMADTLQSFIVNARDTSKNLQRFGSRINGAVDKISAVNDHAIRTIGSAIKRDTDFSFSQLVPSFRKRLSVDETVEANFAMSMDVMDTEMRRLILDARQCERNLVDLEEQLTTLAQIVAREDRELDGELEDLLASLWTKLGGNQRKLRSSYRNFNLLRDLGVYRKQALVHVVASIQTLDAMQTDMDELRERIAAPSLTGSKIPPEVHLIAIRNSLDGLKQSQLRARDRIHQTSLDAAL